MRRRVLLPVILTAALLAPGQVFWRRAIRAPSGWDSGYETRMRVQEGRGEAKWYGVEGSMEGIHAELRNRHGEGLVWRAGENVAWGLALEDGWLDRYLVQPSPEGRGFWVMHLRQREREAGRPGQGASKHQLRELPSYPNSRPSFYTLDEGNLQALEISVTSAPPHAVLDHLGAALVGDGWVESPLNTGGMRWYIQRDEVAIVSAVRSADGNTRVVRLHKPFGVE